MRFEKIFESMLEFMEELLLVLLLSNRDDFIAQLIVNIFEYGLFGYAGGRLTERLRIQAYRAMLRQDMDFFDAPEHLPSLLTANLAHDVSLVQVEKLLSLLIS